MAIYTEITSDNGIGFNRRWKFPLSDSNGFGESAIIFGADMSSFVHADDE